MTCPSAGLPAATSTTSRSGSHGSGIAPAVGSWQTSIHTRPKRLWLSTVTCFPRLQARPSTAPTRSARSRRCLTGSVASTLFTKPSRTSTSILRATEGSGSLYRSPRTLTACPATSTRAACSSRRWRPAHSAEFRVACVSDDERSRCYLPRFAHAVLNSRMVSSVRGCHSILRRIAGGTVTTLNNIPQGATNPDPESCIIKGGP